MVQKLSIQLCFATSALWVATSAATCVSDVPEVCGNCQVDISEECDDGNLLDNDGCSSSCTSENIAVQEWYTNDACNGKILKRVAVYNREYRTAVRTDATSKAIVPYIAGTCSSGAPCFCNTASGTEDYPIPFCMDGSSPLSCTCVPPDCSMVYHKCSAVSIAYGSPQEGNITFFVITRCYNSFPPLPTSSALSASQLRSFVIVREWRMTFSGSKDGTAVADISAWELTRSRALSTGLPDVVAAVASNVCVPEYTSLDATYSLSQSTFFTVNAPKRTSPRNRTSHLTVPHSLFSPVPGLSALWSRFAASACGGFSASTSVAIPRPLVDAAATVAAAKRSTWPAKPANADSLPQIDPVRLRIRRNCTDPLCRNCSESVYVSAECAPALSCQVRMSGPPGQPMGTICVGGAGAWGQKREVDGARLGVQVLAPGRCLVCTGGLASLPIQGFSTWPGPPAPPAVPDAFQAPGELLCQPCSAAPDNYFYATDPCRAGLGCGACSSGMACGACGQKDAPPTACGDPRQGGRPYYWVYSAGAAGENSAGGPGAAEESPALE